MFSPTVERKKMRYPSQIGAGGQPVSRVSASGEGQILHAKPDVRNSSFLVCPDYVESAGTSSIQVQPSNVSWPTGVSVVLSCMDLSMNPFEIPHRAEAQIISGKKNDNEAKRNLLSLEGGYISAEEFAEALDTSLGLLDEMRTAGKVIGIATIDGAYVYPKWQLEKGMMLPGLDKVLQILNDFDPWMKLSFMLRPNLVLEMKSPLNALRSRDIDLVKRAAILYGEQGSV